MKHFLPLLIAGAFLFSACNPTSNDQQQYRLGSIGSFSEMVAADVKQLALSSVLTTEEMDQLLPMAEEVAQRHGIQLYREPDLIVTDLFPADVAEGMEVIIMYKGTTLNAYRKLKEDQADLIAAGKYEGQARQNISRRFGRLLSYSPQKINSLLAEQTGFRTMTDFGVQATNVFLYYKDLGRATDFYGKTLGLNQLASYDNANIFQISAQSYLILVDAAKGMHNPEEPKTVALALLTEDLQGWYDVLKARGVEIKYKLKLRDGGPHDGFVAIDPEGYLLEFEHFKQHPENELFIPLLAKAPYQKASDGSAAPNGMGFNASITWIYCRDVLRMQQFYEEVLGLRLVADQGWTKIYEGSPTGFIGLVDERRGMHDYTDEKAVNISWILQDVAGWHAYAQEAKPFELRSEELGVGPEGKYKAFVGFDPEGYYMEFDQFFEHEDNQQLMEALLP